MDHPNRGIFSVKEFMMAVSEIVEAAREVSAEEIVDETEVFALDLAEVQPTAGLKQLG